MVNEFRQAFREFSQSAGSGAPVPLELREDVERDVLVIPPQRSTGFECQLECMDYGVYPTADGWHSGCWDVTVFEPDALKESLEEFVNSVLNDAMMEIHYSNGKPYKWTLHYEFEGNRISDTCGSLFFNWFGQRTTKILSNVPAET